MTKMTFPGLDPRGKIKEGFLVKSPPLKPVLGIERRWHQRWFVLYDPNVSGNLGVSCPDPDKCLYYFKGAGEKKWIDKIVLRPGTRVDDRKTPVAGYEHVIDLITKDRLFHLCAADAAEKSDWYRLLKLHVEGEDVGRDRQDSIFDERGTQPPVCYSAPDNELARRVRMAKEQNRRDGLDASKTLSEPLSSARSSDADRTDIVTISGAASNQIQLNSSDQETQERGCVPAEWPCRVSDLPLEIGNVSQYLAADSPNRLSGVVSQGGDRAIVADQRSSPRRMDTFRFEAAAVDSCQSEEGANSCCTDDLYCNPRLLAVSPDPVGMPVSKPRQKYKSASMIDECTKLYQNAQSGIVPKRDRTADKVRIKSESAVEYKSGKLSLGSPSCGTSGLVAENELYESADDTTVDGSLANVDDGVSWQQQVDTGHYKTVSRRFHPVENDDVMRPASAFILREGACEDELDDLESPHYEQIPAGRLDFGDTECPDKNDATRTSGVKNSSPMSRKGVSGLHQDLCRKRSQSHGERKIRDSARERNDKPKQGMAVRAWDDRSDLYIPEKDSLLVEFGAKPAGSTSPNALRPLCDTPPLLPRHANVPCLSVETTRSGGTASPVPQHGAPPPLPRRIDVPLTDGPPAREKAATAQFEMTIVRRRAKVSSSLPDRTRQKMPSLESFETIRIDWTRGSSPREPLYAKVGRVGEVVDNLRRNRSVDSNLHLDAAENGGYCENAGDTCESYVRRRTHSDVTVEASYVNASEYRVRKYK